MNAFLVAYATKHGSTAEIAAAIGEGLRRAGHVADVVAAREVRDVSAYRAVVLGSAVYMDKWQGDAVDFLQRFESDLQKRPTWLFSSGPTGGTPDAERKVALALASEKSEPPGDVAGHSRWIGVRGHATFGGRIGEDMRGWLERWMPRGDWRDFDRVRTWAGSIAADAR